MTSELGTGVPRNFDQKKWERLYQCLPFGRPKDVVNSIGHATAVGQLPHDTFFDFEAVSLDLVMKLRENTRIRGVVIIATSPAPESYAVDMFSIEHEESKGIPIHSYS